MRTIEPAPPTAADDASLVATVTALVNRAYQVAEDGLWRGPAPRLTPAQTRAAIAAGELVLARDDGALVAAVCARTLDAATGWFGALAVDVDHAGRGHAGALVGFVEQRARDAGAEAMQIEVLAPTPAHPHMQRLAAWYGRLGYREVGRGDLADLDPDSVPLLTGPCAVVVMRKPLV